MQDNLKLLEEYMKYFGTLKLQLKDNSQKRRRVIVMPLLLRWSFRPGLFDPVCGAYGVLYPNLSRINFLGPSFFRNKFPFPKKGTTPRRTWYTKNIQNQFWDHGGKHLWIKFQWPRSCLSLCKSPTNSAPRNSTLFFGCNPSVAEYFSMGQPP